MSESKSDISKLEKKLQQKEKVIAALTKRVESEINMKASSYDAFQTASLLEKEVNSKTEALNRTLSQLRQQQRASEHDKQFLKRVLNNIHDFVSIISPDNNIIFVNKQPLAKAGITLEDVINSYFPDAPWFDFPTSDKAYIKDSIKKAFSGVYTSKDIQIKLKNGLVWVTYKTAPIFNSEGNVSEIIAEGFLIDNQKKAELALIAEKERIQTTLESIGDAVIVTDKNCIIEYMNPIAEQLTGWHGNRAVGQPVQKVFFIISEVTGKPASNPSERSMKEGRIVGLANHTGLVHRDGHTISIGVSRRITNAAHGKRAGIPCQSRFINGLNQPPPV